MGANGDEYTSCWAPTPKKGLNSVGVCMYVWGCNTIMLYLFHSPPLVFSLWCLTLSFFGIESPTLYRCTLLMYIHSHRQAVLQSNTVCKITSDNNSSRFLQRCCCICICTYLVYFSICISILDNRKEIMKSKSCRHCYHISMNNIGTEQF